MVDGSDYPGNGSPVVDTIAYKRISPTTISGDGKKNGAIALTETATMSPDGGNYTSTYSVLGDGQELASGVAVFERPASGCKSD